MKKTFLSSILLLILSGTPLYGFDWAGYLPGSVRCKVATILVNMVRSYQYAVTSSLALQGDTVALQVWQDLLATYNPAELICLMGAGTLDEFTEALRTVMAELPGVSFVTRQALEAALYKALSSVKGLAQPIGK